MKDLIININAIANTTGNTIAFEKAVISNLWRVQKLGYKLFLLIDEVWLNEPSLQQVINILNGEFQFEIINKPADITEYDCLVEKIDNRFVVNQGKNTFSDWNEIFDFIKSSSRKIAHTRNTNETKIAIEMNLDGNGIYHVDTGLNFFNHMVEQLSKHSLIDLDLKVDGDLHIDEHHTIEDTAIALGEAIAKAVGNKKGMERYGFLLPMDDCLAQVAIDFGGRAWLVWDVQFKREYVGDVPTEMFYHFFKSFSDAAKCNLNIKAEGDNEHHKIESIFKAFAKAIKMAVAVNENSDALPTTKGLL